MSWALVAVSRARRALRMALRRSFGSPCSLRPARPRPVARKNRGCVQLRPSEFAIACSGRFLHLPQISEPTSRVRTSQRRLATSVCTIGCSMERSRRRDGGQIKMEYNSGDRRMAPNSACRYREDGGANEIRYDAGVIGGRKYPRCPHYPRCPRGRIADERADPALPHAEMARDPQENAFRCCESSRLIS